MTTALQSSVVESKATAVAQLVPDYNQQLQLQSLLGGNQTLTIASQIPNTQRYSAANLTTRNR